LLSPQPQDEIHHGDNELHEARVPRGARVGCLEPDVPVIS
jgi:hypothetical protein